MTDFDAEARELTRRFRSHSDADLSLADVQWLDREIAAALRRAAEEAEVRAFGDRTDTIERLERRLGEAHAAMTASSLAEMQDRAALVAAGDKAIAMVRANSAAATPEWDRLVRPEEQCHSCKHPAHYGESCGQCYGFCPRKETE